MSAFVVRRLIQGIITILVVTILVFLVIRILPGDPLLLYMSANEVQGLSADDLLKLRTEYGLEDPLPVQYFNWISNVFQGNLGQSLFFKEKVSTLVASRLPITVSLGLTAFILACLFGPLFGTICALKRGKWIDTVLTVVANLGVTTPAFWLGILMIYFFSLQLHWLPVVGFTSTADPITLIKQSIMPVICLAVVPMASLTRQARSSVLEVVRQDYVRTAWSKGLSERRIVYRHIIKNAFIPIITMMGMYVRFVFGGAVLIETVFNIPGIGRMIVNGVMNKDYMVIQAGVLIIAVVVVVSNLLVDASYGLFDPRIRYGEEK